MKTSPLNGRIIAITRPRAQAAGLAARLSELGAKVVCTPVIRIIEPSSFTRLDAALHGLGGYDCVVFTSANAVEAFFNRARRLGLRHLQAPRHYAIGEKTAAALRRHGWGSAVLPAESRGESLARAIAVRHGSRVLIPRARLARPELPAMLRRRGARVSVVETYRTVADERSTAQLRRLADSGRLDAVTFTSASTAKHLARQIGRARFGRLFAAGAVAASIGPVTTRALRALGVRQPLQARAASQEGLAAALLQHLQRHGGRKCR